MVTKVEIISGAFTNLGKESISDIDEESAEPVVIVASKKYDLLLLNMIQGSPWRFATFTRNLNRLTAEPPMDEFRDAFTLPADFLNLERSRPNIRFRIFENFIFTNSNEFQIDYRAKVDESKFPAYFSLYLEYRLTADMAMPITQDLKLKEEWDKTAKIQGLDAKYQNSQQQTGDSIVDDRILASHFGSSGRLRAV